MELAALVRKRRKACGLTQFDLAVAIGLKQTVSVSRYENGKSIPDPQVFENMIAALGMDAEKAWPLWGLAYAERVRAGLEASGG